MVFFNMNNFQKDYKIIVKFKKKMQGNTLMKYFKTQIEIKICVFNILNFYQELLIQQKYFKENQYKTYLNKQIKIVMDTQIWEN